MKTTKYFIGLLMAFAWMGCSKEDDNKEDIKLSVSDEIFYANHFAKATHDKTVVFLFITASLHYVPKNRNKRFTQKQIIKPYYLF
jgi:hypothetical protein